jgi:hypothetical protein
MGVQVAAAALPRSPIADGGLQLASSEDGVSFLLPRLSDPAGVRAEGGPAVALGPERVLVRGQDLASQLAVTMLVGQVIIPPLNTPLLEDVPTSAPAAAPAQSPAPATAREETPVAPKSGGDSSAPAKSGPEVVVVPKAEGPAVGMPGSLLSTRQAASVPAPGAAPPGTDEDLDSSLGVWLDVLAAASATAALGLVGCTVSRRWYRPRIAGGVPPSWLDEDSSYC